MRVEIIKTTDEFKKLKLEWEELERTEKDATIFQTFLYNYSWWENVENIGKYQLNIVIVREDNGNLLGVAPLIIELEKKLFFKISTIKFMAWGDYLGFLLKTDNTNTGKIISKIFETIEKLKIDRVLFSNIDINSILGKYLKKHQKYNYLMEFQVECPQVVFNKFENFNNYKKEYNYNSLNNLRNKLKKKFNYSFVVDYSNKYFDEVKNIHRNLQHFLNSNNNTSERSSLFENKERNDFLEKFYSQSKNLISFYLLDEKQKIINYAICYSKNGRIINWNVGHEPSFSKYSPGRVINYEIMQWGFEQNNKELIFDFGCGGYPWKFQWTDDFTSVYKLEYNISNNKKMKYFEKFKLIKRGIGCFIKAFK